MTLSLTVSVRKTVLGCRPDSPHNTHFLSRHDTLTGTVELGLTCLHERLPI